MLTTVEAGNIGATDREQLEYATQSKRTIFTFDLVDFVALHKSWIKEGKSHYGILVSHQLELKVVIQRILHFLTAIDGNEVQNQLYFLGKWEK